MLAKAADTIPAGATWLYEPKWDGFRALVFFDGETLFLQSRDLKPLGRYFPELEAALKQALPPRLVLDGEIVIATGHGLDFEASQMRIHPAASRVNLLAERTPSSFVAFDLLAEDDNDLRLRPFAERHERLQTALAAVAPPVFLTPSTQDRELAAGLVRALRRALASTVSSPSASTRPTGRARAAGSRSSTCAASIASSAASAGTAARKDAPSARCSSASMTKPASSITSATRPASRRPRNAPWSTSSHPTSATALAKASAAAARRVSRAAGRAVAT